MKGQQQHPTAVTVELSHVSPSWDMGSVLQVKTVHAGQNFEDQGLGEIILFQALHANQDLPCQCNK